jgi:hypothetical protein
MGWKVQDLILNKKEESIYREGNFSGRLIR